MNHRLTAVKQPSGYLDRIVLQTAAADRAQNRAVLAHQHLGAGRPRRRPPGFKNRGQYDIPTGLQQLRTLFIDLEHQPASRPTTSFVFQRFLHIQHLADG